MTIKEEPMTPEQFDAMAIERGLMYDTKTWRAAKLVLCEGYSASDAARTCKILSVSTVTRELHKMKAEPKTCNHCGQRMPWCAK